MIETITSLTEKQLNRTELPFSSKQPILCKNKLRIERLDEYNQL
jgi:hypothetical protein